MVSVYLLYAVLYVIGYCNAKFTNVKIERKISLSGHQPVVDLVCTVRNDGNINANFYEIQIEPQHTGKISYLIAGVNIERMNLLNKTISNDRSETDRFVYDIEKSVLPGEQFTFYIKYLLFDVLESYPSSIKQSDPHFIRFYFSPVFYSPYTTETQSTTIQTYTDTILSHCKVPSPVELKRSDILYGPYSNQLPFTYHNSCSLHCKTSERFIKIKSLDRQVMVSHWGLFRFEDRVHIVHTGPNLDDGFSRLEYMQYFPKPTAVKSFVTTLPRLAKHIFYRDDVGNISTSSISLSKSSLSLTLTPRYPLFGGWHSIYIVGYDLPTNTYLRTRGNKYLAKLRLIDHIMNDMDVDVMRFKVVLPEKSKNIVIKTPFPLNYTCDTFTYAYLDTVGRPTCTIETTHLSNWHSQFIEVYYQYDDINMFRKPIYVSVLVFGIFFIAIISVRLDFSITKDPKFEYNMKVYAEWDQIRRKMLNFEWTYTRIQKSISKFKHDRNFQDLDNSRKRIEIEFKSNTADLSSIVTKMTLEHKKYSSRYSDFTQSNSRLREIFRTYVQMAQKLVNGKTSKSVFNNTEAECLDMCQSLIRKLASDWQ